MSGDHYLTYRQFNQRINRLANALNKLGVRKGDRVNVLLFNTNELMETLFACAKIGAVFVPINFRLSANEVEYIVRDSGGFIFMYDERVTEVVRALKQRKTHVRHFVRIGERNEEDMSYEEVLRNAAEAEPVHDITLEDSHMMMDTSGTTSRPKGALLSHGNTTWNAVNGINYIGLSSDDITLTIAPLFHIGGMNIFTTPTLYLGVPLYLMILFILLLYLKKLPKNRFGLTETAPFVSLLDSENSIRKNGSVGKPPIDLALRIVDEEDQDVPVGEDGELIVKGPNIFKEYWNMPEETKKALRDGWFYTGDLAKFDEEEFLYIFDRKKDMIITGGENVYPIEIEQILFRHPRIQEVAVVGYPDEQWGESVQAVIALKEEAEQLSLRDVQEFCEGKLGRFKIPKQIDIVDQLPRNATGKVLKTVLRSRNMEKQA